MQVFESAKPIEGWNMAKDCLPELGSTVEILHFGNDVEMCIPGTAVMCKWGLCPVTDGGHGKRSTVTHWRSI